MRRHNSHKVWTLAAIALLTACSTASPGPDTAADPSAGFKTAGAGSPTIVFEAGLGDGESSFSRQFKTLSAETAVFAYDRLGYGGTTNWSGDDDGIRTGEEVAVRLHGVLGSTGAKPPYILVGHSLGGLYVLSFAKLYPEEIAGIVLVDSRPAGFTGACRATESGLCEPPDFLISMFPAHQKSELRGMGETERFAATAESLGAIRVTVISASRPPAGVATAFQDLWENMQSDFAKAAEAGRYVLADGASHYVHHQRSDLVTSEIKRVLTLTREAPD